MRIRRASPYAMIFLALACGGDAIGPTQPAPCTANVSVSIGSGTTPMITWSPSCLAGEIIVDPGTDFEVFWAVATTDSTNGIHSSLRYGSAPSGTRTIAGPAALVTGHGYRVKVLKATGDSAAPFALIGTGAFAP